jgi:hypothetical protein
MFGPQSYEFNAGAENPERVLSYVEERGRKDFPFRAEMARPLMAKDVVSIYKRRGFFPVTTAGWVFNLTMMVVTLGSWIFVYILWLLATAGDSVKQVNVKSYLTENGTQIHLQGSDPEWTAVVSGWLTERYGRSQESAED